MNKVTKDSHSYSRQIPSPPPGAAPPCQRGGPPAPGPCPTLGGRGPVPSLMSPVGSQKTRHWIGTATGPVGRTFLWVGGAQWGPPPTQSGGCRPSSGGPPTSIAACKRGKYSNLEDYGLKLQAHPCLCSASVHLNLTKFASHTLQLLCRHVAMVMAALQPW